MRGCSDRLCTVETVGTALILNRSAGIAGGDRRMRGSQESGGRDFHLSIPSPPRKKPPDGGEVAKTPLRVDVG